MGLKLHKLIWACNTLVGTAGMAAGVFSIAVIHRLRLDRWSRLPLLLPAGWIVAGFWGICTETRRLEERKRRARLRNRE